MIDLSIFMEPRGVIKVFQFIFVICAFACTCDFRGVVELTATCPSEFTVTSATTYSTAPPSAVHEVLTSSSAPTSMGTTSPRSQAVEGEEAVSPVSEALMFDEETLTSSSGPRSSALVEDGVHLRDDVLMTTLEPTDSLPETVIFKTMLYYPFKLDSVPVAGKNCNNTDVTMSLGGNYAAPSSFYVFVGVSAMLYTLMAVALYTAFKQYYEREWVPVVDLAIHFAYTVMWFAGSVAWAVAVTAIKEEAKLSSIVDMNPSICSEDVDCSMDQIKWQLIDFSIVFGFLNFVLYLVNMWFIFKETTFYSKKAHPTIS